MNPLRFILGLCAAVLLPALALADGFCPSYGVQCRRAWTDEDRPALVARWLAPEGDYVGSIRLADGQSLRLPLLECRPASEADRPDADWDAACNQAFPECQGRCVGR